MIMETRELLENAIEKFRSTADTSDIRPGRKKFFDAITCRDDQEGLRVIDTIGGESNNMAILAGRQHEGSSGVISFSFVRKEGYFAIQVISTLPAFIPSEQLVIAFKFENGKEVISGFIFPPVNVEGTSYWANYAQISAEDLAAFMESSLIAWQLKNKVNNDQLESDFTLLATDILPQSEAKYLLRSMASAIAKDYVSGIK